MKYAFFLFLLIATSSSCGGRPSEPPSAPPPASTAAVPTPAGPESLAGLGSHRHPIATTSPEAQKLFDQGFTLVFAFNHEEALRSFQRAAELDPRAAMPHWGIAWAIGPNYNLDVDDPAGRSRRTTRFRRRSRSRSMDRRSSGNMLMPWRSATRRTRRPIARRWRRPTAGPWASCRGGILTIWTRRRSTRRA